MRLTIGNITTVFAIATAARKVGWTFVVAWDFRKHRRMPIIHLWLKFSRDVLDELTGRSRAFVAKRLPDACLILGKSSEVMFHEANNTVGRELWHHATSEEVSTWLSYRPEVPVLVNSTIFMDQNSTSLS